jgi:hypothetical protein
MDQRIPKPVQPILESYVSSANAALPDLIQSVYIVGSIALGEFNERFSDIDFITVLNHKISQIEFEKLRDIHKAITKIHPSWKMSGSYLQASDLGKLDEDIEPHPHYHDEVLRPNARHGLNLVTWWELKNHGVTLIGMEPKNLAFHVNDGLLIKTLEANLSSYWKAWTIHPRPIILLCFDWGIQWAVLGVLRQFYTFRENLITTKVRAATYALGCLAVRWHPIIQEAINIREGETKSAYRFRIARAIDAVQLLKYIIRVSNSI